MLNRSRVYNVARERVPVFNNSNSEEMSAYIKIHMMLPNFEVVPRILKLCLRGGMDEVKKCDVIPMRRCTDELYIKTRSATLRGSSKESSWRAKSKEK